MSASIRINTTEEVTMPNPTDRRHPVIRLITRVTLVLLAIVVALVLFPEPPLFAAGATPLTTDSNSIGQVKISPLIITVLVSLIIPVLTGLVTKTSSRWKAIVTLVLNVANAVVTGAVMVGSSYVLTKETLITIVLALGTSLTSYVHLWKPLGVTNTDGGKLSNVGRT